MTADPHAPEPVDDRELIGRVLAGDPAPSGRCTTRTWIACSGWSTGWSGDLDRAQDYVQETFIRAFQRLGEFRGETALSTWLCSIAISVTLNGLRKLKRAREREVALDEAPVDRNHAREAEPDLKVRLTQAIDELPEGYRTVFVMHDVEGYTHEEIAARWASSPAPRRRSCSAPEPSFARTGDFADFARD